MDNHSHLTQPRILVFDLDGTLVSQDEKQALTATVEMLQTLKHAGHDICLATGRTLLETLPLLHQLQPTWPVVCFDGRLVYDAQSDILLQQYVLPRSLLQNVQDRFATICTFALEHALHITTDRSTALLLSIAFQVDRQHIKIGEPAWEQPVLRAYLRLCDPKSTFDERLEAELQAVVGDSAEVFRAGDKWICLSVPGIDKYHGLSYLLQRAKREWTEVVSCGDGRNDLMLFQHAGLTFAPRDAHPELLQAADVITEPVSSEGIIRSVARWFEEQPVTR